MYGSPEMLFSGESCAFITEYSVLETILYVNVSLYRIFFTNFADGLRGLVACR